MAVITQETPMWDADEFGTAVTNRDWSGLDYIFAMTKTLRITVEQGARDILIRMPTNHRRLSPRAELIAAHRVCGQANDSLGNVLANATVRWGCEEIPDVVLLAACMEAARQWKDRDAYTHVVLAHKPRYVRGELSQLYFRLTEKRELVLGHTCVKGLWYLPGTLFVFAMPPRRR